MSSRNSDSSSQPPPPPSTQAQPQQQQQQNQQLLADHEQDPETHGDTCSIPAAQSGNADSRSRGGNTVFKSGPLSISSKGLGWTTWKKRWFILTRTSLVFFRSDPSAVQQRGSEVNLTLGGIDLNNSGSVVVKADKKLLTVLFPDGRDGRAFTLKADTMEDLQDWKAALENALTQAPSASHVMGQNGIFRNEHADTPTDIDEQKDEEPSKSAVIGRPVLLALEDVDGSPSFLEKALRFVEDHGSKIEGILRQAADVDDVEHRIREYEQGRNEFTPGEDAHVIADCLKYVLRELSSSPVPASCCNALLDACRTDRGNRVSAMRAAISESFPEPNRRLLQRILMMMQVVASNKNVNRMNTNAVAACMAPLLLRPLLAGDCEIENDFDVGGDGDGSMQLLQAAAAANHAQAIVITLLEEYNSIFGEGSLSPGLYTDSDESGSGTEEGTDDEDYDDDDEDCISQGSGDYTDEEEDFENDSNGSYSESAASAENNGDYMDPDNLSSESKSKEPKAIKKLSSGSRGSSLPRHGDTKEKENVLVKGADNTDIKASKSESKKSSTSGEASPVQKSSSTLSSPPGGSRMRWGRDPDKKKLSMEYIDFSTEVVEDNADIERLESAKSELEKKVTEEVKNNAVLHATLERRKTALYARRQALEKDVERLQEQLKQERNNKIAMEAGLNISKGNKHIPDITDENLKKDLQDVAQAEDDIAKLENKVDDLETRIGQHEVKPSSGSKESRKGKQKGTESSATNISEGMQGDVEKQQESRNKQEMPRGSSKATGMSKRSGSKGEGTSTTTSALSKLTMRLNFLKERRSQIANELLNMDKGRTSGLPSPSSGQNRVSESSQDTEKGAGSSDNSKLDSPHVLDRGRSEGDRNRDKDKDKDRGAGGNLPNTTQRTFSR